MRQNRLRELWHDDRVAINGWLQIPSTFAAETMAHQGWDSLTVDMQHGAIDYQEALQLLQAISTTDVVPLVRVPWLEPSMIMRILDAGAYGIICPMINSRADAEALVSACRYPPDGNRSVGPIRGYLYGGPDYIEHANDTIVVIAMVETAEALENLDEIVSTPGLDAIYVGPSDLSMALGYPARADNLDGPVAETIETIRSRVVEHGLIPGLHNLSSGFAANAARAGFRLVTVGSDARLMAAGARAAVEDVRNGMPHAAAGE